LFSPPGDCSWRRDSFQDVSPVAISFPVDDNGTTG
jgi:hypothetical protein